jgi:hypothetical protein
MPADCGRRTYVPGGSCRRNRPSLSVRTIATSRPALSRTAIVAWYGSLFAAVRRSTERTLRIVTRPSIAFAGTAATMWNPVCVGRGGTVASALAHASCVEVMSAASTNAVAGACSPCIDLTGTPHSTLVGALILIRRILMFLAAPRKPSAGARARYRTKQRRFRREELRARTAMSVHLPPGSSVAGGCGRVEFYSRGSDSVMVDCGVCECRESAKGGGS